MGFASGCQETCTHPCELWISSHKKFLGHLHIGQAWEFPYQGSNKLPDKNRLYPVINEIRLIVSTSLSFRGKFFQGYGCFCSSPQQMPKEALSLWLKIKFSYALEVQVARHRWLMQLYIWCCLWFCWHSLAVQCPTMSALWVLLLDSDPLPIQPLSFMWTALSQWKLSHKIKVWALKFKLNQR